MDDLDLSPRDGEPDKRGSPPARPSQSVLWIVAETDSCFICSSKVGLEEWSSGRSLFLDL